jgi:DNA invertase Pin-like site-specific DNA recombinase
MKVAIYSRCSTTDQSVNLQLDELRDYCKRRQWEVFAEYSDQGVSGSKESRPSLNRMLADAKRRRFDCVLVYRYDRAARSLRQLVNLLCEFDALGIAFVSLHEGVDTTTPGGRLVFGIFASIAEFERQLIIARTRSGIEAARRRGKVLGRPRRSPPVDLTVVRSLRQSGMSWDRIATHTGITRATLQRAVKVSGVALTA